MFITDAISVPRRHLQWFRVALWIPYYMGVNGESEGAAFITADDPLQDGDGFNVYGNTAGIWRVYANFPDLVRDYPRATFTDTGYISLGEDD